MPNNQMRMIMQTGCYREATGTAWFVKCFVFFFGVWRCFERNLVYFKFPGQYFLILVLIMLCTAFAVILHFHAWDMYLANLVNSMCIWFFDGWNSHVISGKDTIPKAMLRPGIRDAMIDFRAGNGMWCKFWFKEHVGWDQILFFLFDKLKAI